MRIVVRPSVRPESWVDFPGWVFGMITSRERAVMMRVKQFLYFTTAA